VVLVNALIAFAGGVLKEIEEFDPAPPPLPVPFPL
jgi:hypothetical protein